MSFEFENFEELLEQYENEMPTFNEGDIASGIVIGIDNKTVTVDIGGKTVGYIPLSEFADEKIEINSSVDVYIEKIENKKG